MNDDCGARCGQRKNGAQWHELHLECLCGWVQGSEVGILRLHGGRCHTLWISAPPDECQGSPPVIDVPTTRVCAQELCAAGILTRMVEFVDLSSKRTHSHSR